MAALVQTYPQQTGTVTMLQTRPSSTSGIMSASQPHANHQYMGSSSQAPRSAYHGTSSTGYRGSTAPVQPYAFTSTPNLNQTMPWQQYGAYRTNSSPAAAGAQSFDQNLNYRAPLLNNPSTANMGYAPSFGISHGGSRDDSSLSTPRNITPTARPQSYLSVNTQPSFSSGAPIRNTPERYRRPSGGAVHHSRSQSSTLPSSIAMANTPQLYNAQGVPRHSATSPSGSHGLVAVSSFDDMHLYNRLSSQEDIKRMRRRSMHTIDTPDFHKGGLVPGDATRSEGPSTGRNADKDLKPSRMAPHTTHSRSGSSESVSSTRSSHSRPSSATNRNVSVPTGNPSLPACDEASAKSDQPKLVNIPPRGSSSDAAAKRTLHPSPLSKPATMANDSAENSLSPAAASSGSAGANFDSPAAKQLAAINQKGGRAKSKTSRLRRAFSFGSAADFRKAAGGEGEGGDKSEPSRLHKEPTPDEAYDAEQARIAEAQEAAGIGNSIYGGRFFGSTDNLSISSTASSASIMIRKMGRGMKKSTRSLVGLFRPKSVVGVPAAEVLAPEASQAEVSMITVEAETQRVNVTADPSAGNGGTGFPRLERNSLDAAQVPEMTTERLGSSGTDKSAPRKSIVGGDKERAEVLAAVRKGILKRSGSSSPSIRPAELSPDIVLPNIPAIADSPISSAPSTPNDESQGHKRTGSIAIGNEDYFMSALRLRQDTKSPPGTPHGSAKRNATFSPRIIFYDTWPSQEYDRRGEIATCNRLTPMLAQQIKEELNTFKMEMEVHENSKIYTHFF
ncbi:Protein BNI4 [Tolypocladium ophioglossoides CBS 100239]|uniref:Protein BNI4 n=1 Tax=Tolypocladium ophioglossoides (strain CBS 100239) TaxID=1163406 RepID=A0A0L0NMK9_TOLOC|nr:Protein BNI4 [Tolypocladium ophioglossoides CBS 100239]KND95270.1 Protein BNI4 [Tolypocladium ophioglossoides CBS 100239]